MKPLAHARLGQTRNGIPWQKTIQLHTWLDSSKASFASVQHRALLHHALGAQIASRIFADVEHEGVRKSASELIADHVIEDLGDVVPVSNWLDIIPIEALAKRRVDRHRQNVLILQEDPAKGAAALWGGQPEDYLPLIDFFALPEQASQGHPHARALWHNSFGPFLAEMVLGPALELNNGRLVATRTVAEDLILARAGWIPPASFILHHIPLTSWMCGDTSTAAIAARKSHER
jgi:hypothetical protein